MFALMFGALLFASGCHRHRTGHDHDEHVHDHETEMAIHEEHDHEEHGHETDEHGHEIDEHGHVLEHEEHDHAVHHEDEHGLERDEHGHRIDSDGNTRDEHGHLLDKHGHVLSEEGHAIDAHGHVVDIHGHMHDEHGEEESLPAGQVHFTHAQAEEVGLQMETVKPAPFQSVFHTGGKILSSQNSEHTIVATSSGVISFDKTSITEGSSIHSGESIVSISSDRLQDGDPVKKAKVEFESAEQDYLRAQKLIDSKIISEKEFNQIRARYETAKAAYQGQANNFSGKGISVKAPSSGYLKQWLVQNGQYVNVGEPIAIVAQDNRLRLQADVPESYFRYLRYVQDADFRTSYDNTTYRISELNGKLLSFGKSVDEGSAYLPVVFEFDNTDELVPGSFTDVYLLGTVRNNVLSVPLSSIVEEQGLYFVFVKLEEEMFKKVLVNIGQSDGRRVEIRKGIVPGDEVVTHGTYSVKLAAAGKAIPGHSHNH